MAPSVRFAGLRAALALGTACALGAPSAKASEPSATDRAEENARARCDDHAPSAAAACADARLAAARAYRAAGARAKAVAMARLGLAGPGASIATRTALATELADGYAGLALFDEAASAYATALEGATDAASRGEILLHVLPLWFALGSEVEAGRQVATFTRRFPDAPASGTLVLGVMQRAVEQERWSDALAASKWGADHGYPVDVSVQLAVLAARATRAVHHDQRHVALAQAALRAAGDAATLVPRLHSAWPDEDEGGQTRRLARVLTAVGEARFMVAEAQQRAEVDVLRIPALRGGPPAELASVTLRPWIEKKRAAIESVSRAYAAVVDVQPAPPPRWVVAAGRAVGLMWARFVDELDGFAARHKSEKDFRDAVRGLAEPYRSRRAQPAMRACVSYATKFQWVDPGVRDCERWLAKNYPGTLVPLDEIVPRLLPGGLSRRGWRAEPPIWPTPE